MMEGGRPGGFGRGPRGAPGGPGSIRSFRASIVLREKTGRDIDTRSLPRSGITLRQLCELELIETLARDQHGSRYIQTCLETAAKEECESVFTQVYPKALSLCEDVFGNYVIQKLFEHGTDEIVIALAQVLIGRVLPLTKSMYGCRVIQKAFECVEVVVRGVLVHELEGHVEECVRDQNGNHVIQKAIEQCPTKDIQFIVDAFLKTKMIPMHSPHHPHHAPHLEGGLDTSGLQEVVAVCDFAAHPYGCRVIQRLLEKCEDEQKQPLLDEILKHADRLSRDQYGNYVVQHILQFGTVKARRDILQICADHILTMSKVCPLFGFSKLFC